MAEPAVFLIHGLGGTQYDLGSMHKRLKNAGFVTYSITLPGHGGQPSDLIGVRAEDWLEAVRGKYREIVDRHEVLHVMGMCMGSLLAIETCKREGHTKGRLVALAPPVFLDGWSTPWYRALRHLIYWIPGVAERMRVDEEDPYGIKNDQLRAIVRAKFERGDAFAYRWYRWRASARSTAYATSSCRDSIVSPALPSSFMRARMNSPACARRTSWSSISALASAPAKLAW